MAMDQQALVRRAKSALQQLYDNHRSAGILALYIWGSITRSDFDPATSDIDVICIVADDFALENNERFKEELTQLAPEREWGFQVIYLDELNGGAVRSRLAQAMSPQSILPSFNSWVYVCGTQFGRSDFSVADATITERMRLNIAEIRWRLASIPSDDERRKIRDRKGTVKACLLLIYNRQLNRGADFELDYNVLAERADNKEAPILQQLLVIKKQEQYDETFTRATTDITAFAAEAERELS